MTIWVMVQLNDGATTATLHDSEEAAYADIVDTAMGDTTWIGLDEDEDKETIAGIEAFAETHSAKETYEKHIEPRLEGIKEGFYMEVVEACDARGQK